MRHRKRFALAIAVLFLAGVVLWLVRYEPEVDRESILREEGTVVDRAISGGIPYLTVAFPDGRTVCCWVLHRSTEIPDGIGTGNTVYITYGIEQDRRRYAVLDVQMLG